MMSPDFIWFHPGFVRIWALP
eukprot:SAG22_NODE_3293_length_1799_cov_1.537059_1_plen_20_part_10